jgi:hypothetical protein
LDHGELADAGGHVSVPQDCRAGHAWRDANPDLATGNWVMRCEERTLNDIRALGGNDAADERRFATAARISETNLALYRTFAQPIVCALVNSPLAEWMQQLHPLRLQYKMFSDTNPMMASVATLAEQIRKERRPVATDNPFVAMQENVSRQMVAALDAWRDVSETLAERTFLAVYGLPTLQAAVGVDPAATRPLRKAPKSPLHRELLQSRIAELKSHIPVGGLREAVIRGILYVGMARTAVDERGFEAVRRIRRAHGDIPLLVFKTVCASNSTCCWWTRKPRSPQFRRCFHPMRRLGSRRSTSSSRRWMRAENSPRRTSRDWMRLRACSASTQAWRRLRTSRSCLALEKLHEGGRTLLLRSGHVHRERQRDRHHRGNRPARQSLSLEI